MNRQQNRPAAASPAQKFFICDAHVDTLSKMLTYGWSRPQDIHRNSHVTLERLRQSALGLVVFACFTEKNDPALPPLLRTLKMIDLAHQFVAEHADWMQLITDYAGFKHAHRNGKLAVLLSLENGVAVEEDISLLRTFHRLGVRMMSLTWNHRNKLGDGAGKPNGRRGLTSFGREVLAEMERLGIIVDVSHLNERTFWDVLEASSGPVVATHSNAFSVCAHVRNLTDDQIRAIAQRKGFIGLNFCGRFLKNPGHASVKDVIAHARHIADIGGVDVPAIGSDFDGITDPPAGLEHVGKLAGLTGAFEKAGFSRTDIKKLSHQNFLRVFKAVC